MKKVSYLNAVRDGIAEEMRKDPTIFMIGEGISERGGSYAQTKDCLLYTSPSPRDCS